MNNEIEKCSKYLESLNTYNNELKNKMLEYKKIKNDILKLKKKSDLYLIIKSQKFIENPENEKYNGFINYLVTKIDDLKMSKNKMNSDSNSNENLIKKNNKLTKEDIVKAIKKIIYTLNIGYNLIDDYYAKNLWKFLRIPKVVYRADIEPNDLTKNPKFKKQYLLHDFEIKEKIQKNLIKMKFVEIVFIKKRKNSSCYNILNICKEFLFENYIMRKDESNNIMIKGFLKVSFQKFENYFLHFHEEYKNLEYILINMYLNEIDLLDDFDEEYDFFTFSKSKLDQIVEAGKEMNILRNFLGANLNIINNQNNSLDNSLMIID